MGYNKVDIGKRIYEARNRSGYKQEALSKRIGIHQSTLSDIENGKTHVTVYVLYKISGVLGVPVTWLLGETNIDKRLTDNESLEVQKYIEFLINKRV